MAAQSGVWGIDIGQCALKALRLEQIEGQLTATNFDYVEHPKILSQPDADPDALTREALTTFLSRNSIKGDHIAISVPGQSGLARFVKLPPVEEAKIGDIVKFEAKQQIPFPLEEVVWDYQKIGQGIVTDGFALETEIGLFAMKRDMVNRYLNHFSASSIEVHTVQMSPLSLVNFAAYELLKKGGPAVEGSEEEGPKGKRRCVVALDLGTDGSNLIITDAEKIIWQRPIPLGGNHFTRALTKEMKLTFAKAEHVKRHAAKSADLGQILKALKPVLQEFVGEVQRSLGYFTNTHRDAAVQYMVGLGNAFRLPGLQKFLSEKLQIEVKKPNSFERITGESVTSADLFRENLLTFPIAYGLAIQGLRAAKLQTNLLPQEIRFDRMIRAKKPWAVAAAASLLLGTAIYAFGNGVEYGSVATGEKESPTELGKAVEKSGTAVAAATKMEGDVKSKEDELGQTTRDVKSVIAGTDERPNWLKVNEYISACLPHPFVLPEGNDPKAQQAKIKLVEQSNVGQMTTRPWAPDEKLNQPQYWLTPDSQNVLRLLQQLRSGEGRTDIPLDLDSRKHLAQIDVEGVEFRYMDNLESVIPAAIAKRTDLEKKRAGEVVLEGLTKEEQAAPPKDPGWVVMVRGYTYHDAGRLFIADTLVQNLNTLVKKKAGATTPAAAPAPAAPLAGTAPVAAATPPAEGTAAPVGNDPIEARVSHAFLYMHWAVDNAVPGAPTNVSTGAMLEELTAGDAAAVTQGTTPAPSAGRAGWTGGLRAGSGGTGGGGGMPGMGGPSVGMGGGPSVGMGGGGSRPGQPPGGGMMMPGGRPGGPGMAGPPGTTTPPPAATSGAIKRRRHEFVVIFHWREPVPSDKLFGDAK